MPYHSVDSFLAALPVHDCSFTLVHNPHKDNYETVADFIDHREWDDEDWVSLEEKNKALAAGDFWYVQWYPRTPVGFYTLAAHDLGVLLDALVEMKKKGDAA